MSIQRAFPFVQPSYMWNEVFPPTSLFDNRLARINKLLRQRLSELDPSCCDNTCCETMRTDCCSNCDNSTIIINVGYEVSPEDIKVALSNDHKTLTIEVNVKADDNGLSKYLKQSYYSSDKEYDQEELSAELQDGDLLIHAPYVIKEDDKNGNKEIENNNIPIQVEDSE